MSQSPFEQAGSLRVGTVEFVSPDELKVNLDIEAPEAVTLDAGGLRPFPRVNGYLLIPVDVGYLVGQVEWITIERSAFPKRRGMQDFGLIDLPFPLRRLSMTPLGMLRADNGDSKRFLFSRGTDALPSIGSPVILPTERQLVGIVDARERIVIGNSALAGDAPVSVNPNRLFGRHLAILGNTGSGKSCSVAGVVRWSIEQAAIERRSSPTARFIIFDPNGEYSRAFSDIPDCRHRIFRVASAAQPDDAILKVPLWFWTSAEWSAFAQASAKMQRPLLKRALRDIKSTREPEADRVAEQRSAHMRRMLTHRSVTITRDLRNGKYQTDSNAFGYMLAAFEKDLTAALDTGPAGLPQIIEAIQTALSSSKNTWSERGTGKIVTNYRPFTQQPIEAIIASMAETLGQIGGPIPVDGPDEDTPVPFRGADFADHLETLILEEANPQHVESLLVRIRAMLADKRQAEVIDDAQDITLASWLSDYLGDPADPRCNLSIIDLSLVPSEVVHVVTAVIARMIFEALQRHMRQSKVSLPTVMVMEEAHTFIKRYRDDIEVGDAGAICCQAFERIAREGRKFGLGLVLSSQRPSELSPTVLSQCNTFLLHRISNDRDQELIHRLVPDNLKGLLRELPSLPPRSAILLGWASELPVLVRMRELSTAQRPKSDDPDFWSAWTGQGPDGSPVAHSINWSRLADEWQAKPSDEEPPDTEEEVAPDEDPVPDADEDVWGDR